MTDLIVIAIVVVIVGSALGYIIRPRNAASNALAARPAETAHPVLPRARPPGTAVVKRIPAAVVRNKNEKHRTENPRLLSVSYPYKCKRRGAICSAPLVIPR